MTCPATDLSAAFSKVSLREAWALCEPHPLDASVLVTQDARGLHAIAAPNIKTVILKRAVPEDVADFFKGLMEKEGRPLKDIFGDLTQTQLGKLPPVLARELGAARRVFSGLFGMDTLVMQFLDGRGAQDGQGFDTRRPHIDDYATLHTSYAGDGVELFLGDLKWDEYRKADREGMAYQGLPSEILPPGDVVAFKGYRGTGLMHQVEYGHNAGQMHRTPKARPGSDRLALTIAGVMRVSF